MDCAATFCRSKTTSAQGYAQCGGYAIRNISLTDVTSYAQRSGVQGANQLCYVEACLLTGRLIYWKNNPGDCPTQSKVSLGSPTAITKGLGLAGTGLAAASGISLFATGGAGIGASAAGS